MLRPVLEVTNLNIVLSVLGLFMLICGFVSLKVKQRWYLGEVLPAFVLGIIIGPEAVKFINVADWGADKDAQSDIAYGLSRLVIGVQLVKAGYELPGKYLKQRFLEMMICLLPVMIIMWLVTAACIMLLIPNLTFLSSLVIGACVVCIDPVLSQGIAKGPFADNYVRRPLREFISAEAGGNDGVGFPFLLLAVALLRYAETPDNTVSLAEFDLARGVPDLLSSSDVGRFGGGIGTALKHWGVEGVIYMVLMGFGYGALVGYGCRKLLNFALRRKWVDNESFLLFPTAIGLFVVGTCGCVGSDETMACFIAGNALNWDGKYLAETELRHDSFNPGIETLLNFGAFMFLGAVMPWGTFQMPQETGITVLRLIGLGFMILAFRRIPAVLLAHPLLKRVCHDWKEALFMGYFGPIGIGAIAYVEFAKRLFPHPGTSDAEINHLTAALTPVVYWLVFFSIVVHGLSVPALNALYKYFKVPKIYDSPVEIVLLSENEPLPNNSTADPQRHSAIVNNRFSRAPGDEGLVERNHPPRLSVMLHPEDAQAILRRSEEGWTTPEPPRTGRSGSVWKENNIIVMRDLV
ncbi:hypothetical protein VTN00DRAFT_4931 [Thermoascus crustaceus]|uniref:uncharacterized protein n=1 Tax=Thermoascus crustaceus TaxID=5088 RepID=UPI0037439B74